MSDDLYDENKIRRRCVMCDKPLRRTWTSSFWRHVPPFRGWKGNDWFCTKTCAAEWGVLKCSTGDDGAGQ